TGSRITSAPPQVFTASTKLPSWRFQPASAPNDLQNSTLSALPAVTKQGLPDMRQSWSAAVPTPLAPAWSSTRSPGCNRASMYRFSQAVANTSGKAAASRRPSPWGTGKTCNSDTTTCSAYPPPASNAQTSSPTANRLTSAPTASTQPLTSNPMTSEAPEGGG